MYQAKRGVGYDSRGVEGQGKVGGGLLGGNSKGCYWLSSIRD